MTTVSDIVLFLERERALAAPVAPSEQIHAREVTGVAQPSRSGVGDLSWLSQRYSTAEEISSFAGALLLCSADAPVDAASAKTLAVSCHSPKWAFSKVVNEFFAELLRTEWPRQGDAAVSPDADISDQAVLGAGVVIGPDVQIGNNSVIGPNSCLAHVRIGARVRIGANCTIGTPGFGFEKGQDNAYVRFPHIGTVVIEDDVEIGSNTCIDRGALGVTRIQQGAKIDNLVHIAHNVDIGVHSLVIAHAMIAGSVRIGRNAWIAPSAAIMNQVLIGENAVIGMGAVVLKDVPSDATVVGNPARVITRGDK